MNRLIHPATDYLQRLEYRRVPFRDLDLASQIAISVYMAIEGEAWELHEDSGMELTTLLDIVAEMAESYGEVEFGVGELYINDTFKRAFTSTFTDPEEDLVATFNEMIAKCDEAKRGLAMPVILARPEFATDDGLFQAGHDAFYYYWMRRGADKVPFIKVL
jgi:hypothetical protein